MDENSPVVRAERSLWRVWSYISEAVNRFLWPQPAEPVSSDSNSPDESGTDSEPPDSGLKQDDTVRSSGGEEIDEEQLHSTISLLNPSLATVTWTVCTSNSKSDKEEATQLRKGNEAKESEDSRSTREEGLGHEELLDTEEAKGNQVEQEETDIKKFHTCEQSETPKNDEESADVGSIRLAGEIVGKKVERSDEEGDGDEKSKTQDDHQNIDEATTETQVTEDDEEKLCIKTNEDDSKPEEGVDIDGVAPTFKKKEGNICEGVLQLSSENENTSKDRRKPVDSQLAVCEMVSENELIVAEHETGSENDEKMPSTATEEEDIRDAAQKQAEDEEPETEKYNKTIEDGQQEENVLTESFTCSEASEEDVGVIVPATETGVVTAQSDLNKSFLDKDQVGKERSSSEVDNKDSCVESVCTSVTVKPETVQEVSTEFKNIPQRMSEGQATMLHEPNTEASGETREGVPEHNNELQSDKNKTQGLLEGGNSGEIHIIPLPEEVEDEERARLKTSGTGADYLLEGEILDETQDRSNETFGLTVEEITESQHSAQDTEKFQSGKENLESEFLFEEKEVELRDSSMKTKFKPLDKELETCDETDKTMEERQNGVKAPEFGIDEPVNAKEAAGDGDERKGGVAAHKGVEFVEEMPNFLKAEAEVITETSLDLDSVQSAHKNQKSEGTFNLKNTSDLEVLQQLEIKLSDVNVENLHVDAMEEDFPAEDEEDDKMQDINQTTALQLAETTDVLIKTQKDEENALITELALSLHPEREMMINQSPLKALRMQEINTTTDTESKTTKVEGNLEISAEETEQEERYTEETSSSVTGHQDVIDEEILDLWIETAMSKDTDNDEDQFKTQKSTTEHQFKEESAENAPDCQKEQVMEPHSPVSDTEASSEPGVFDHSQQPKPTLSLEDVHNRLVTTSQPADSSEFSALDSEAQAELMERTAETAEPDRVTESCSDSGLSSLEEKQLNGESERSQEEPDENPRDTEAEMETRTEEADVASLIKVNVHFQAEAGVEDESVVLEEVFVSTEPPSGGEHWLESEDNQTPEDHRCSGKIPESLLKLSKADVEEEQTVMFEDQDEVDALLLDSRIQRSRISVKNPRVRPPTDPRSLIHMPSADPTPPLHVPVKLPPGVPLGGLGMGFKLPGLGGGFPVLKKTQQSMRREDSQSTQSQEPENKVKEKSEGAKQNETQHKPKWMPPGGHAGFGNPLMSELRTKLKKTTKE